MTKEEALQEFFSSFDLPAYPSSAVPEDATFPWLTYDIATASWESGEVSITINLWYYTTNEAVLNAKAREISEIIGYGGKLLSCDGGFIWLKRGSPWCQNLTDSTDRKIKRRYINLLAEFMTLN